MNAATALSEYCTQLSYDSLPDDVQTLSKQFVLDTLGIGVRSLETDSGQAVYEASMEALAGEPESTIWATGERQSAACAAFVNGSLVHMLELDDTHREAVIHPGAPIIATAFAIGERENASGESFLTAVVAGYEVACRLGKALRNHRVHLERGFHGTSTCGIFGAAVAGGLLTGFDAEELSNCFGIVLSQASGSLQYKTNGAWTKRIHPGLAARDAVLAVSLGKQGFRGAADPLTGTYGFLNMYGVDPEPDRLTAALGADFEIRHTGIKPYACCRYNHPAIDATLEATSNVDLEPAAVESVILETFESAYELANPPERKIRPENTVDAQFSPQYAVGVALSDGQVLVDQYTHSRLEDPDLRRLLERIDVVEDESMTARYPEAWPARVTIETEDGRYSASVDGPRGEPEHPLTSAALVEKFEALTGPVTIERERDALIDAVLAFDDESPTSVGRAIHRAVTVERSQSDA